MKGTTELPIPFNYGSDGSYRTYTVQDWDTGEILGRSTSWHKAWEAADPGDLVFSEWTQTGQRKVGF